MTIRKTDFPLWFLLLLFLLPACSNVSTGPTTVTLWVQNSRGTPLMHHLIDEFNQQNRDIRLQLLVQSSDAYTQAMRLAFQSHQAPDVFLTGSLGPLSITHHWSLPLNSIINKDVLRAYQPYLQPGENSYQGVVYSIPTEAQTSRLMYNRTLFRAAGLDPRKPPTTYSELLNDAQRITESAHGNAFGFGMPMKGGRLLQWNIDPLVLATHPHLTKQGLFDQRTQRYQMTLYQPAIALYRALVKHQWVYPGAPTLDSDMARSAFARGKIGMMIGASFDLKVINKQFQSTVDWDAAPLPVPDGDKLVQSPSYNGLAYAISASTPHPQAAARVLEYLVSVPVMQQLEQAGEINALLPAAHSPVWWPKRQPGFSGFLPTSLDVPVSNGPSGFLRIQGLTYGGVISKLIERNDEPLLPALNALNQQYDAAYQGGVHDGSVDASLFRQ